jgi:hypothetical protein
MGHFPRTLVSATDGSEDVALAARAAADLTNTGAARRGSSTTPGIPSW